MEFAAMGIGSLELNCNFVSLNKDIYDVILFGALLLFLCYAIWKFILQIVCTFQDLLNDPKAGINSMVVPRFGISITCHIPADCLSGYGLHVLKFCQRL